MLRDQKLKQFSVNYLLQSVINDDPEIEEEGNLNLITEAKEEELMVRLAEIKAISWNSTDWRAGRREAAS